MLTAIGMWICLILAGISFLVCYSNDATFLGCIIALVFIGLGRLIFSLAPKDFQQAVNDNLTQEREKELNGGCTCPNCGMNAGYEISLLRKEAHYEEFGLNSVMIGKNYECYNCGHMW